jgi:nitrite reductase/ring-hydroxylating ferredoxin subunit
MSDVSEAQSESSPSQYVRIGASQEIPERGRKLVATAGTEIAIFRLHGELYALENYCAHFGGPACQGKIINRVVEILDVDKASRGLTFSETDVHVVCPWHGYEYNITTGEHAVKKDIKLRTFNVSEHDGDVIVEI